jgi:DNA-directed RNA polymerase alpha subunit/DNA-directed RNA polymerase subunit L
MRFTDIKLPDGSLATKDTCSFTLAPINVAYANTLRRLIMTGVETVAFRADMTDKGTTTDVKVLKNDTPMTNEMLAHRIGLLPIHVPKPLTWNPDKYTFRLTVTANKDSIRDVTCSDFEIRKTTVLGEGIDLAPAKGAASSTDSEEEGAGAGAGAGKPEGASEAATGAGAVVEKDIVDTAIFFPPHPVTKDTCLIATLAPGTGSIDLIAKATIGTGREHARFQPISRCTYTYTRDMDAGRLNEHFNRWLQETKKVTVTADMRKDAEPLKSLLQEFNTMEVNRVYLVDEKGEPFSFDFVVRSIGPLDVTYIVERACDVGEAMVARYANIDTADLASLPEITVSSADSRLLGFDFLFKGHDHTLGNLLQTWLVENNLNAAEDSGKTPVTFAGYVIPHPLRDEMLLRIGVADGKEATARKALAEACAGCAEMFRQLKVSWITASAKPGGMSRMEAIRLKGVNIRGTIDPAKLASAAPAVPVAGAGAGAGAVPLRGAMKMASTAAKTKPTKAT